MRHEYPLDDGGRVQLRAVRSQKTRARSAIVLVLPRELLVDCQSLAEGVSGAIACARMMAVRSNPATGTMQIPPLDDIGGGNHTYRR